MKSVPSQIIRRLQEKFSAWDCEIPCLSHTRCVVWHNEQKALPRNNLDTHFCRRSGIFYDEQTNLHRLATHTEGPTGKFSKYSTKQKSENKLRIVITFLFNKHLFFLPFSFSFHLLPFFRAIIGRLCLTFLNFSSSLHELVL
jgi:hypothetical protein